MPEHRLICPISKNSSPDAHTSSAIDDVITIAAIDVVVSAIPEQPITMGTVIAATDAIIPGTPVNDVVRGMTNKIIPTGRADDRELLVFYCRGYAKEVAVRRLDENRLQIGIRNAEAGHGHVRRLAELAVKPRYSLLAEGYAVESSDDMTGIRFYRPACR
jgi:hypothetical protein